MPVRLIKTGREKVWKNVMPATGLEPVHLCGSVPLPDDMYIIMNHYSNRVLGLMINGQILSGFDGQISARVNAVKVCRFKSGC